jgi:hypothetical protein
MINWRYHDFCQSEKGRAVDRGRTPVGQRAKPESVQCERWHRRLPIFVSPQPSIFVHSQTHFCPGTRVRGRRSRFGASHAGGCRQSFRLLTQCHRSVALAEVNSARTSRARVTMPDADSSLSSGTNNARSIKISGLKTIKRMQANERQRMKRATVPSIALVAPLTVVSEAPGYPAPRLNTAGLERPGSLT